MIISGMDTNDVVGLLADYYSIKKTLKRKGYVVGSMDDISRVIATSDEIYELLKNRSRRRVLRAVYQEDCRDIDAIRSRYNQFDDDKIKEILQEFLTAGTLTMKDGVVEPIPDCDLGVTFEWFIAEVIKRELSGIASFGVHIKELSNGGDFDVIGRLEDVVLYVECKAGSLGNITRAKISEFIERDGELSPDLTLLVVDSEYISKSKSDQSDHSL